jgi:serine/threonine protein kinase/tetratricopeptide (TPR) repeat protein
MLERAFGKYELVRRLGRGGMADVYLAHDAVHDRQVALKLVEVKGDRDSRDIRDAERRGAVLQQQFCAVDSHVPEVHEYDSHQEYFYIDMEYVEGEDLAERLGRGALAPEEAVRVALEVCAFLERAHAFEACLDDVPIRGIIHGDIKPKNIRLKPDGQVKVLDFGIAKGLSLTRKLTRNDFGSLSYLSPERLDSGEVDVHADYWSVGVLLYEMLAGAPPFDHQDAQKLEQLIRSRQAPPPLPETCPPALARVVVKMLAGNPARRYPDAGRMHADLRAALAGKPTEADRDWLAIEREAEATRRTHAVDSEATRRTDRPGNGSPGVTSQDLRDADATRRSGAVGPPLPTLPSLDRSGPVGPGSGVVGPGSSGGVPSAAPALGCQDPGHPPRHLLAFAREGGWPRRAALAAVFLAMVGVLWNEAHVWSAARELRVGLATRQDSEIRQIWTDYEALSHRSLLGLGLTGVRGPLKERLVTRADQVMADYRQDSPTVREAQWQDAAECLTDALRLDPGDRAVSASLRYCEGQLQRINGEARKRRKLASADGLLRDAVAKFQDAARMNTRWPDPYLGLARTYIYGLDDLDKAIDALNEAERRGYRAGNRELIQMADGYRSRADRMVKRATEVRGMAQEPECLQKAVNDYRQAIDLFGRAIGFGDAGTSLKQVQKQHDTANARLEQVKAERAQSGLKGLLRSILGPK